MPIKYPIQKILISDILFFKYSKLIHFYKYNILKETWFKKIGT